MMTATNHTEHYDLSQYTEDDRPAYAGDCNSDMSRIDAALTASAIPAATGLTAEQLDSQYSDGYDIVRVGTPTPQTETEVDPNE